jgi:transposase
MSTNEEVNESIRPRFKLSRDMINRSQKLDYALVSSLEREPLLKERPRRLRTVPGVGPITALTWALDTGDDTRFTSNKQAISYCGLCGDENSSADKVMRMPIRSPNWIARIKKPFVFPSIMKGELSAAAHWSAEKDPLVLASAPA